MTKNRSLKTILISMLLGTIAMGGLSKLKTYIAEDRYTEAPDSSGVTCYMPSSAPIASDKTLEEINDSIKKLEEIYAQKKITESVYQKRLQQLQAEKAATENQLSPEVQKAIKEASEAKESGMLYSDEPDDPVEFEDIQKEIEDSDNR